jgi:alkylated DNA repair dioxygenase AlkB
MLINSYTLPLMFSPKHNPAETACSFVTALSLLSDFITSVDEQALLKVIDEQSWLSDLKRRVQHYGYRYDYTARQVTMDLYLGALPECLQSLANRLHQSGLLTTPPDQVIINEYEPGQGIAPHVDCVPCFGDTVASLSLLSGCLMDFSHIKTGQQTNLYLPPCSLLILKKEARYHWQHGIAKRKSDTVDGVKTPRARRVSLTFRNVLVKY